MIQDYFIVDGEKYYTGTIFIIDFHGKHREASFICKIINEKSFYKCKIDGHNWLIPEKMFLQKFMKVTDKVDPSVRTPVVKKKKETEIDSLFNGWLWYVFLMVISVVLKDAIAAWIIISVVFFSWRAKKIKKEGTYIEW